MKAVGIIGAMEEEVASLKNSISLDSSREFAGMEFSVGSHNGVKLVIVRSGIGKVNAAVCTQLLIDRFDVGIVINTGYAGALDSELSIGDLVISDELVQHDFDTSAFGDDLGFIPRLGIKYFEADQELKDIAFEVGSVMANARVFIGKIASGDQFISSWLQKARIADQFDPLCVEMEGAAIAQCCWLNKVPFVVIRCISDKSDGSAEIDFTSFIKQKAEAQTELLLGMIDKLKGRD